MGDAKNRYRSNKRNKTAKARRAFIAKNSTGQSLPSSGNTRQDERPRQPKSLAEKVRSARFVREKKSEHPQNPALVPTITTIPRRQSVRQQCGSSDFRKVDIGIHFERWTRQRRLLQLSDVEFMGYLLDLLLQVQKRGVKNCRVRMPKAPSGGLNLSNAQMKDGMAAQKSQRPGTKNDKVESFCIRNKTAQVRNPNVIQKNISSVNNAKRTLTAALRTIRLSIPSARMSGVSGVNSTATSVRTAVSAENTTKECSAGKIFVLNNKTAQMPDINSILKALQLPPNVTLKKLGEANLKSSSLDSVGASALQRIVAPSGVEAEPSAVSVPLPEITTQGVEDGEMILPEALPGSNCQKEWVKKEHEDTDEPSLVEDKNDFGQLVSDVEMSFEKEEPVVNYIKTEPADENGLMEA